MRLFVNIKIAFFTGITSKIGLIFSEMSTPKPSSAETASSNDLRYPSSPETTSSKISNYMQIIFFGKRH